MGRRHTHCMFVMAQDDPAFCRSKCKDDWIMRLSKAHVLNPYNVEERQAAYYPAKNSMVEIFVGKKANHFQSF